MIRYLVESLYKFMCTNCYSQWFSTDWRPGSGSAVCPCCGVASIPTKAAAKDDNDDDRQSSLL